MLRKTALLLCLILLVSLLPWNALAGTQQIVHITHYQKVNVRKGPGSGYGTRGEVRPGDTFLYLGSENGWYCIQYTDAQKGWVWHELAEVITVGAGDVSLPGDEEAFVCISNRNRVNVRSGPGTGYKVLCEVKPGTRHTYLGTVDGWHKIELEDGRYGFVANNVSTIEGRQYEVDWPETDSASSATSRSDSDSNNNQSR